jgi:dihydrofolate synthase/folylpolyglutamate synthase
MVAGTNGKGSTCAMLEAILLQPATASACTSSRTSSTLTSAPASTARWPATTCWSSLRCGRSARGDIDLTYFEFTTLAIMHLISKAGVDVAILEVGLGGRLDAVNVIDADVSIVTSIDIDHKDYLGDTREKSASRRPASSGPASRRSAAIRCRRNR